jgi:hypothetical protein
MAYHIAQDLDELARAQGGVVTRQQALDSGLSRSAITRRLKYRKWRQFYRGVYVTFTGPMTREAQLWAAVLYAGRGARLSHETAAGLHGLTDRRTRLIHVTIPADRRLRRTRNLVVHISASAEVRRFPRGVIPHTLVEETVLDLVHSALEFNDACGWVTAAFAKGLTTQGLMRATMEMRKRLRWRHHLDEMVTAAAGGTHSVLEFRYDRHVERAHGLPAARRQVPFTKPNGRRGFRDRYYAEYGLVVELDGKLAHPEHTRRRDKTRDNAATADGGSTLRYDWQDVTRDPCHTAAQVADALQARGWTGRLRRCSRRCRAVPDHAQRSA